MSAGLGGIPLSILLPWLVVVPGLGRWMVVDSIGSLPDLQNAGFHFDRNFGNQAGH